MKLSKDKNIDLVFKVLITGWTLAVLMLLFSCNNEKLNSKQQSRITLIESQMFKCGRYELLLIDNHEYLTNSRGGIIHLESCGCQGDSLNQEIKK